MRYALGWGYGGIMVGNLFAYRATNPKVLKKISDPIGPDNRKHLLEMIDKCEIVVLAYGDIGIPTALLPYCTKYYFLDLTKKGIPKHPLYLKKNLLPRKFNG